MDAHLHSQRLTRAAVSAAAVLALTACSEPPAPPAPVPVVTASPVVSGAAVGEADKVFAQELLKGRRVALALSGSAVERATDERVRTFAAALRDGYRTEEGGLVTLLGRWGVAVPDALPQTSAVSGDPAEYDRAYLTAILGNTTDAVRLAERARTRAAAAETTAVAAKAAASGTALLVEVRKLLDGL